jgi:hypothetical protein
MASAMTRILKLQKDGVVCEVPVRIFWPVAGEAAWDCRWEIDWPEQPRSNSGRGIDAVQALFNALTMVGAELYCSDAHKAGQLTWDKEWLGYGFPVSPNLRDMLMGEDKRFL